MPFAAVAAMRKAKASGFESSAGFGQPPVSERMPDATNQILIRRDERGRLPLGFEGFAQDQRDGRRLILGCFGLDERQAGNRAALSLPFIAGEACPLGCRRSGTQRLAQKRRAARTFAPHRGEGGARSRMVSRLCVEPR